MPHTQKPMTFFSPFNLWVILWSLVARTPGLDLKPGIAQCLCKVIIHRTCDRHRVGHSLCFFVVFPKAAAEVLLNDRVACRLSIGLSLIICWSGSAAIHVAVREVTIPVICWSASDDRGPILLPLRGTSYDRPRHFSVTVVFGQSQRLVYNVARNGCIWKVPMVTIGEGSNMLHRIVAEAPVLISVLSSRRTCQMSSKHSAHFGHVVVITVESVFHLFVPILSFVWAVWGRPSYGGHSSRQGGDPGLIVIVQSPNVIVHLVQELRVQQVHSSAKHLQVQASC